MSADRLAAGEAAFPRLPLYAAIAMVAASLLATAVGRYTGVGADLEMTLPEGPPARVREMRFVDRADGGIDILDAAEASAFAALAPGEDGFARATLRGLVRDRKRADIGPDIPFRLSQWSDGRLVLEDPATGRRIDLRAFGATNADAFARLLPRASAAAPGGART